MGKGKLKKFQDLKKFSNVFQNTDWHKPTCINYLEDNIKVKGVWRKSVFKNDNPIVLELACGKGEYTVELAQTYPNQNFIGIDIKGNRIWKGSKKALELKLPNAHFLRTRIELLHHFFEKEEVNEVWVTFPDPHLRGAKSQKRLTSERFLNIYKPLLKAGATINLKTDSKPLYDFTKWTINEMNLNLITDIADIYANENLPAVLNIKTYYEKMHLAKGLKIYYLKFEF